MSSKIPLKIESPIDLNGFPETYLRQRDFNQLVARRAYPVYIDKFMACPCQEKGTNSARLTCKNCFGTGWVIAERLQTSAMVASINMPTEMREWSIENIGTVQITTLSRDPVNFMDRIILYKEENIYSELIFPRFFKNEEGQTEIIAFCAYPPVEILNLKAYKNDNESLVDIDISKVIIDKEGKLILTNISDSLSNRNDFIYNSNTSLSIRYKYHPSYHIIDVNRSLMTSGTDTPLDKGVARGGRVEFPYSSMGRQSHLVIDRSNLINLPNEMLNNGNEKDTSDYERVENNLDISKTFCNTEKQI